MVIGGKLKLVKVANRDISKRNILVHPPEPPMSVLFPDPTTSIYVGRTKVFNVPFYWTHRNVANPHIAVVGISGSGKSYFHKDISSPFRLCMEHQRPYHRLGRRVQALGEGDRRKGRRPWKGFLPEPA